MQPSDWKLLLKDPTVAPRSRVQLWARVLLYAAFAFVVSFTAAWLFDLIRGNDFSPGDAMPIAVGIAAGTGAVQLVRDLGRQRRTTPAEAEPFDDLPKRLG